MKITSEAYTCTLSRNRLLYFEIKTVSQMVLDGLDVDQIKTRVISENVFQYRNKDAILKSLLMCLDRLAVLDDDLRRFLAHGDSQTGKLVAVYAIYKTDRLFREFIHEFVQDNLLRRTISISYADMNAFFREKREQSPEVAGWSDRTFVDLRGTYIRILVEIHVLSDFRKRHMSPVIMPPDLQEHLLRIGETEFVRSLTGGRP